MTSSGIKPTAVTLNAWQDYCCGRKQRQTPWSHLPPLILQCILQYIALAQDVSVLMQGGGGGGGVGRGATITTSVLAKCTGGFTGFRKTKKQNKWDGKNEKHSKNTIKWTKTHTSTPSYLNKPFLVLLVATEDLCNRQYFCSILIGWSAAKSLERSTVPPPPPPDIKYASTQSNYGTSMIQYIKPSKPRCFLLSYGAHLVTKPYTKKTQTLNFTKKPKNRPNMIFYWSFDWKRDISDDR